MSSTSEKFKVALFDLDDTLLHEGFPITEPVLCDDTMEILKYLKARKVKIVLATHNYSADDILKKLSLIEYFDLVLAYYDYTDKVSHLWKTLQTFDFKPANAVFYDDLIENIDAVRRHGACGVLVDHIRGVTLEQVTEKFD